MTSKSKLEELQGATLVLVAHQDDETVGCGALLQRMREPSVVFATDGAPHSPYFWEKFGSRKRYAEVRRREALDALSAIGVDRVYFLSSPDQELYLHLSKAAEQLLELSHRLRPEAVLTHAYEGGHPDHDCCAFLGYLTGKRLRIPVWEMPLYWRAQTATMRQQPLPVPGAQEAVAIVPSHREMEQKRRMAESHHSQRAVLEEFSLETESVRPQPDYDFSQPPHQGPVNYEAWGWKARAQDLCSVFHTIQDSFASPSGSTT